MSTIISPLVPTANRRVIVWYGTTIFLSSAILLVMEIVAGRLIAPYVGVSIYSWTSIIGVILAGLSLGNWLGGRWADRGAGHSSVGIVLLLAAIFCVASLLSLTVVAPMLQGSGLDLISSSFIYVLSMFFLPAMLLGVVTPLLTTMSLRLDSRIGHIVGRLHALAALGSILGTFVTGYWLVQYFGTRNVIIGCALLLVMLALPFLRGIKFRHAVLFIGLGIATLGITQIRGGFSNPCQWESNYFCLRVVDASAPEYGAAKALILDHLMHGINHEAEPSLLISPYVHAMDEIVRLRFNATKETQLRYFFAGGGAYTQPRAVQAMYPAARITVAELDPQVTAAARQAMFVAMESIKVVHLDARTVLQTQPQQYDVVITDVFHDISIPYHMVTQEFARTVKQRLQADGIYLINVVDIFPDAKLLKSMIKTLQQEFKYVDVWLDRLPDRVERVTYVVSAYQSRPLPDMILAHQGFNRRWLRINAPLLATGTDIESLPALTDDFVPVERLLAGLLFSKGAL